MTGVAMRQTAQIWTDVTVTVGEQICALAALETIFPLALILVAILPLVNAVTVHLVMLPFTNVRAVLIRRRLPDAEAVLGAFRPLTFIRLSILP